MKNIAKAREAVAEKDILELDFSDAFQVDEKPIELGPRQDVGH